jgi:endopeptidase Clp ATP-binding regulatory subunit ClpX
MLKTPKYRIEKVDTPKSYEAFYKFNLKPAELEAYLDEYIVGQREAKAIIATKICTHFHKIKNFLLKESREDKTEFIKNNIFIIGPTGVGKTYMIKLIAKKIGVPFVKGDATKFSETGYVGGDIEDLIRELYWEANGDLEKARFGMVFLDEIDKIASPGETIGPDISRTGVQRALLKPLEETEVEIKLPQEGYNIFEVSEAQGRAKRKKITINTKYVLFIVSGAFQGLEDLIKKRIKKQGLGFISEIESKEEVKINYLKFVIPEDLVNYGFEREFVGRFPVIAVFEPLTEEELYEILANPNDPIVINKKRDFKVYDIDLAFTDEALREIARLAYKENTGARALARILERILIPFERTLPSLSLNFLGVTKEIVENPHGILSEMSKIPYSPRWKENYFKALEDEKKRVENYLMSRQKFQQENKLEITPKRLELIFKLYKEKDVEVNQAIDEILSIWRQIKSYELAFERKNFVKIAFTEDAIDNILEVTIKKNWGVFTYCEKALSKIEYTLNYFKGEKGKDVVYINSLAFKDPERFIKEQLLI